MNNDEGRMVERKVSGSRPPWCDIAESYCSLQDIPIMSYLPNSYKFRSGTGVSAIKQITMIEIQNPKQLAVDIV
jgi:hypothetical protein